MPQDKPAKIGLNLDTIEREGDIEPFAIALKGKHYVLKDAADLDWKTLLSLSQRTVSWLGEVVDEAKRKEFLAALDEIPGWKVQKLAESYEQHYGLPAIPEGDASPRP